MTSIDDLVDVADVRAATGLPVLVIGRGSNTLVADTGFDGLALTIAGFADQIEIPALEGMPLAAPVEVAVGGGVALPVLARRTAAAGLTGFEWAVGVPGSIGGAVRMNAGGHGSDMAASLLAVDTFDLDGAGRHELPAARLGLRFRASDLGPASIVLGAPAPARDRRSQRCGGRDRRHRPLAAGSPAGGAELWVGVRQPGSG